MFNLEPDPFGRLKWMPNDSGVRSEAGGFKWVYYPLSILV